MPVETVRLPTLEEFERAADEYAARETPEDVMQAVPHARQSSITEAAMLQLKEFHPEVSYFKELLVQFFRGREIVSLCPDDMVALNAQDDWKRRSYKNAVRIRPGVLGARECLTPVPGPTQGL
jgi:hypothetical protein